MIVTLCGSTRFKEEFLWVAKQLTLQDCIVLMPGVFSHSEGDTWTEEEKEKLDKLHKRKIAMSDAIYVINKDGYIGESTKSEIAFAENLGIPVHYAEKGEKND